MRMPRPTRSLDGKPRMTIRVAHRLDREEVIDILCQRARLWSTDELPDMSAMRILADIKLSLLLDGETFQYWRDEMDLEEAEAVRKWAEEQIEKVWPHG